MKLSSVRTTTIELDETERAHLGTIVDYYQDHHAGDNRSNPVVSGFADTIYKQLRGQG
jgi:hypothetical protein